MHSDPPTRTNKPFFESGRWAWDMLPLYAFRCEWQDQSHRKGLRRRIVATVTADSAFSKSGSEPDPREFDGAERASSTLCVELWAARGRGVAWEVAAEHAEAVHPGHGVSAVFQLEGAAYSLHRVLLDIHELAAADALDRLVLSPIRDWAPAPPAVGE